MPPVISKPVNAIDSFRLNGSTQNNLDQNSNLSTPEIENYVDPNLAHIVSSVVSNMKSDTDSKKLKKKTRTCKDPCSICSKNVNKNQKAIECKECLMWSHASCNGIGKTEYVKLVAEADDVPWYCIPCLILANAENFPFGFLSKTQLCELYGNDSPSQVDTLPSFEILSKLNNIPSLNSFDIDEKFVHTIDSKYYRVQDLPKSTDHETNFSLFHANIRSLSKHFDELQSLLSATKIPFDIIGLTESKQSIDKDFLTNVKINDYQLHTQPSKSSCGGIAMYVKKSLDHSVLSNFNATEDEYEALWVEINTGPKSRNIICCCAYRHPDTDASKFLEYMESIVSKFENKNKLICIMGDFNLNLLNYESHSYTNDFINFMVSHYLIPHILQPTRVTDHSATVIDNMFTNATDFEATSGNILNQIADHYAQFLVLKKVPIVLKDSAYYSYDYSKLNKDKFCDDFSKLSWSQNDSIDINSKFADFHEKVSSCVSTHVPLIKLSRKK